MGSTTLFTFLFEHPTRLQSVELFGSWDNFSKPYHLQRDRRRGHGVWSGCYTFDNIICDGDLQNVGQRRSGALKMGGTYWYYYNVDGIEERHNPSEPSTTACPLLPGQRLNVLEVPQESGHNHNMGDADVFTRNPRDKFLTPIPPVAQKALPSPRLGDLCSEPYRIPTVSLTTPRSATYPYTTPAYSPGPTRHARSASTTPASSSTALFADFKCLKEKFAQKRSASHVRAASRNVRNLEIGAPTLISTTAEEVNLIPLSSLHRTPLPSPLPTPLTSKSLPPPPTAPRKTPSLPASVQEKLRQFSPLGFHPIEPAKGGVPSSSLVPSELSHTVRPRSRSDVAPNTAGSFGALASVTRAKSTDTRRTKLFSNEPWLSSPRLPRRYEIDSEVPAVEPPVLQRPDLALELPSTDIRPTSSHGGDPSFGFQRSASDRDKSLPPLPRYLVPAPLYACSSADPIPQVDGAPKENEYEEIQVDDARFQMLSGRKGQGHFSIFTAESGTFSSPTSDDGEPDSPTFSCFTSDCSDAGSPQRFSRFSISDYMHSPDRDAAFAKHGFEKEEQDASPTKNDISMSPPKLQELRSSSFEPCLFDLDIQHPETAPRRQAACFGLGFQGYKLPDDEIASKTTVIESSFQPQPAIQHSRGGSVARSEALINDFAFLGDAVN